MEHLKPLRWNHLKGMFDQGVKGAHIYAPDSRRITYEGGIAEGLLLTGKSLIKSLQLNQLGQAPIL